MAGIFGHDQILDFRERFLTRRIFWRFLIVRGRCADGSRLPLTRLCFIAIACVEEFRFVALAPRPTAWFFEPRDCRSLFVHEIVITFPTTRSHFGTFRARTAAYAM